MSIERMSLVTIRGDAAQLDEALLCCLDSGVFHPQTAAELGEYAGSVSARGEVNPYSPLSKKLSAIARETDIPLGGTGFDGLDLEGRDFGDYIDGLDGKLSQLLTRKRDCQRQVEALAGKLTLLGHFSGLEMSLDALASMKRLAVRYGRLSPEGKAKFDGYGNQPVILLPYEESGEGSWCLYICAAADAKRVDGLFQSLGFEPVQLPEDAHGTPKEAMAAFQEELDREREALSGVKKETDAIAGVERQRIQKLSAKLCLMEKAYELRDKAVLLKNEFVLMGHIPQQEESRFLAAMQKVPGVAATAKDPSAEPRLSAPVRLKNNWFVRPFEMFVEMYGRPSYTDIDPTPYVAATYILLFGIMFGDLGQGLVVSLLGTFLYKKKGMAIGGIMSRVGLCSMVFGFLYGSVFGFETLLTPVHRAIFGRSHLIEVLDGSYTTFLLLAAVSVGAFIIIASILFNIILGLRQKNLERVLFSNNGIAGLIFYLAVIYAAAGTMLLGMNVLNPVYIIVLILIPLVIMLFKEPLGRLIEGEKDLFPEGFGGFFAESFFELFESVLSFVTNTMSFLRAGAFVLVHAGMMVVVFTLSGMAGGAASPIIVVIGNIFVMGMEGLIVGIQVLRLEFYEIFSRFYDGDGRTFEPAVAELSAQKAA